MNVLLGFGRGLSDTSGVVGVVLEALARTGAETGSDTAAVEVPWEAELSTAPATGPLTHSTEFPGPSKRVLFHDPALRPDQALFSMTKKQCQDR
jgi:hypothetical protein